MILLLALAAGLSFFFFFLILLNIARDERRSLAKRLGPLAAVSPKLQTKKPSLAERFLRLVNKLAKILKETRLTAYLDLRLQQAGLPLLGNEFIIISLFAAAAAALLSFLISFDPFQSFLLACCVIFAAFIYLFWRIDQRKKAFNNQLSDALNMIGNSMRAGFSFMQAIDLLAREMKPPLGEEFERVVTEMRLGASIETALNSMAKRAASPEFDLVVAAVLIQRRVGGSLAQILANTSHTIEERIRLRRETLAITAQGRMSGWVLAVLPFAMGAIMSLISPHYLDPVLNSGIGRIAIGAAIISDFIGLFVINKIVNIDA